MADMAIVVNGDAAAYMAIFPGRGGEQSLPCCRISGVENFILLLCLVTSSIRSVRRSIWFAAHLSVHRRIVKFYVVEEVPQALHLRGGLSFSL